MRKILLLVILLLSQVALIYAQDRTVSGTVSSATDGTPLPGVNVIVKGTANGAVSDANGKYTLSGIAGEDAILTFSFIGLQTQEVVIGSRSVVDITMEEDVAQLNEVVITGYGEQEARAVTGSVTRIGAEKINLIPLGDVARTLQGNIAGLYSTGGSGTPGAATEVRIRGIGSAVASAEPLYIVDGIAIQTGDLSNSTATANALANINPNDIENVTVLKDASATAIYGSRGSNGVVLITTKTGKVGKTQINAHIQHGFSDQAYQRYESLSAEEYVMLRKEAYLNSGGDPALADAFAGSAEQKTDWNDVIFRTGNTKSYDVSVQGGDAKTKFFASGGYYNQNGITIHTDFERFAARFNVDHQASDKFSLGLNFMPSHSKQVSTSAGSAFNSLILQSMLLAPNVPLRNEDGTYYAAFPGVLGESSPGANDGYNPLAITSLDRNDNNVTRMLGKVYATYDFLDNLSLRSDFSVDLYDGVEQVYQNSQFGDGASVSGRSIFDTQRNMIWQTTNTLSYNTTLGDKHNLSTIGVFEAIERRRTEGTLWATGFANDKLINAVNGANPEVTTSTETNSALYSYLVIGRYDYDKKYYFSGSFRRDGSSRFGADVKFGNFWSAAGAWTISEESFMQGIAAISNLKLRAGYGTTGNEAIGDFQSQGLYQTAAYNGQPGFSPSQIANPRLTWEKAQQFNVGIDLGLFNSRLTATVERYNRRTTDLLFNVPVSRLTGFNSVLTNAASIENRGWEVTIGTVNVNTQDFRWNSSFNIAINKNEVLEIGGGQTEVIDGTKKRTLGHDWSEYYLAEYAGVNPANGVPLWYDENGNVVDEYSAALRVMTGKSATPKFFGGFSNNFTFRGFDLSALFSYSYGAYIYDNFAFVYESNGGFMGENQKRTQLNRWQKPGDVAQFPKRLNGTDLRSGAVDTQDLQDGSFIRLRNLQFGYTLPSTLASRASLRSLRLYVMGTNLATFSEFDGLDPEQLVNGVDSFNFPNPRTISIGVDLGF